MRGHNASWWSGLKDQASQGDLDQQIGPNSRSLLLDFMALPCRARLADHLVASGNDMIDFWTAKIEGHRRNIQRYIRLLATELTKFERQYLHNQIAEEQAELMRLELEAER